METKDTVRVLVLAMLFVALVSSCSSGKQEVRGDQDTMRLAQALAGTSSEKGGAPETVYEKNGWKLIIRIENPGSWSQGYRGYLFYHGRRIAGKPGEILQTPLGELHWLGTSGDGPHLWYHTGWMQKKDL